MDSGGCWGRGVRCGGITGDTTPQKHGRKLFRKQYAAGAGASGNREGYKASDGCWYLDVCDAVGAEPRRTEG